MAEQQHRSLYSLARPAAKLELVDPFSDNLERPLVIVDQATFGPVDKATVAMPAFPWTQQYNRCQILKLIEYGQLNVNRLITHRLPYTEAGEAYRLLRDERDRSLGGVLTW